MWSCSLWYSSYITGLSCQSSLLDSSWVYALGVHGFAPSPSGPPNSPPWLIGLFRADPPCLSSARHCPYSCQDLYSMHWHSPQMLSHEEWLAEINQTASYEKVIYNLMDKADIFLLTLSHFLQDAPPTNSLDSVSLLSPYSPPPALLYLGFFWMIHFPALFTLLCSLVLPPFFFLLSFFFSFLFFSPSMAYFLTPFHLFLYFSNLCWTCMSLNLLIFLFWYLPIK